MVAVKTRYALLWRLCSGVCAIELPSAGHALDPAG